VLGLALRDIWKNITSFQPAHSLRDFAEQGPASSKPIAATGFPQKSRQNLLSLAFVLSAEAERTAPS